MLAVVAAAAAPAALPPGEGELLAIGKRIYRDGILPSGQAVEAIVAGDVRIRGTQFTCVSCHQRSGLGSSEGWLGAPIVTEWALYEPKETESKKRPAYTDETLATALREGIDPAGNAFDPPMPRYDLPDDAMDALIAYLKTLSTGVSPGVTEKELHFATVVAGEVDPTAMLAVLQTYFEHRNRLTRNEWQRYRSGAFYRDNVDQSYRSWILHVWHLDGPPDTWRAQLEARYREQPVFTLISGLSSGTWRPMHEFCEHHEIPCLLPNTDVPVVTEGDYYTLYLSQGVLLEARVIAARLSRAAEERTVLQVFREGNVAEAAAGELHAALGRRGLPPPERMTLPAAEPRALEALHKRLDEAPPDVLVLWLEEQDLAALAAYLGTRSPMPETYLSSTLIDAQIDLVPPSLKQRGILAHPFSLPDRFEQVYPRAKLWLEHHGVQTDQKRVVAQTYFACMVAVDAKKHIMFDYYYRDYLLECIDHMSKVATFSAAHPNPSFGPGQRYLSKGCYLIGPADAEPEWVIP